VRRGEVVFDILKSPFRGKTVGNGGTRPGFLWRVEPRISYKPLMVRIREIVDPELKRRVLDALAQRRGCSVASIPEWFELDDADFVDLLNDLKADQEGEPEDDSRM
jgi:hypothetical protein